MTDLQSALHAIANLPGHIAAAVVCVLAAVLLVVPSIAARMRGDR